MRIDTYRPGNRSLSLGKKDCGMLDDVLGKLIEQEPMTTEEKDFFVKLRAHVFLVYTNEPKSELPDHIRLSVKGGGT